MYANLYGYRVAASSLRTLCGKSREIIIRIFRCQFVRVVIERIRKINLSINHTLIRSNAWQDKAQRAMFLQRFVVSLFPAWDNCSKAGC
jgi:hypothetical protein